MSNNRIMSFKYAFEGINTAFREEPNLKFHILVAALTIGLGYYLQISLIEWLILTITICLVLSLELTNTAIEAIVDSFTSDIHPGAKKAKDVAAGAVLVASIGAIFVGLLIFLPYFI